MGQGGISLQMPWIKTRYEKETFSNCSWERPRSQGCQAAQLQTGTVPHILTLSYSLVQNLFSPLGCSEAGVLLQLHQLLALKGPWCQQSSTFKTSQCRTERQKHKPRRNGHVSIAPCKYMQAWTYPMQGTKLELLQQPKLLLCLQNHQPSEGV